MELNSLIKKYCYINIPKNSGVHKFVLILIQKGTTVLPSLKYVPLERGEQEVGVGPYNNKAFYSQNKILKTVFVATEREIIEAISSSVAGTEIIVAPGKYKFGRNKIAKTVHAGEPLLPIILRAQSHGDVEFLLSTREGLVISQPFWRIENIIFKGIKNKKDTWIDHAIHIINDADGVSIANNSFINFNAHIKVNGGMDKKGQAREFPDFGLIEHNNFFNEWKRNTARNAVVPIDIVGGNSWSVKSNFIADFGKNGNRGRGVTMGAYIKGAASNGKFVNNLIACEWNLPHTNPFDVRVGLSFGGGGTNKKYCRSDTCEVEHKDGLIDQNVIINCENDVGIYLNKASNTIIRNNYIFNSLGIDVRYSTSSAIIDNNAMDGRIRARNDGNLIETFNTYREQM